MIKEIKRAECGVMEKNIQRAVDRHTVEKMYPTTYGTLSNLASRGLGPKFYKRGRRCLYRVEDLDRYFFEHPIETSDSAEAQK